MYSISTHGNNFGDLRSFKEKSHCQHHHRGLPSGAHVVVPHVLEHAGSRELLATSQHRCRQRGKYCSASTRCKNVTFFCNAGIVEYLVDSPLLVHIAVILPHSRFSGIPTFSFPQVLCWHVLLSPMQSRVPVTRWVDFSFHCY